MTMSVQEGSAISEHIGAITPQTGGSLLLIEDNPVDALRTMALLRVHVPDMSCQHVATLAEATPELVAAADCVLLDLGLPDAHDQEGLKEVLHRATDVLVVVLTGVDDPLQTGLESLRNGAQDYLTKDALDAEVLERSIRYAIERKTFQAHLADVDASRAEREPSYRRPVGCQYRRSLSGRRCRGHQSGPTRGDS